MTLVASITRQDPSLFESNQISSVCKELGFTIERENYYQDNNHVVVVMYEPHSNRLLQLLGKKEGILVMSFCRRFGESVWSVEIFGVIHNHIAEKVAKLCVERFGLSFNLALCSYTKQKITKDW